jgi:hypothetical protein
MAYTPHLNPCYGSVIWETCHLAITNELQVTLLQLNRYLF